MTAKGNRELSMGSLTIEGQKICNFHFDEDKSELHIKFSQFFSSLSTEQQIDLLERHLYTLKKDLEIIYDSRSWQRIEAEDDGVIRDLTSDEIELYIEIVNHMIFSIKN